MWAGAPVLSLGGSPGSPEFWEELSVGGEAPPFLLRVLLAMWMVPQCMERDKDDDGQGPWSHSALWETLCPSPLSPSILVALGAQAPARALLGKGEGASGRARRTKKASLLIIHLKK